MKIIDIIRQLANSFHKFVVAIYKLFIIARAIVRHA